MRPGLLCTSLKIGLVKGQGKYREFFSLAQEINRVSLCGECVATFFGYTFGRGCEASFVARKPKV
jgi:hypothetical protein